MTGWIAPTDRDWFDFLASRQGWEEVNFWRPSDYYASRAEPGAPFLFKLKAPFNAIAGFGYFVRYDALPEWLAWECFGPANGAPTFDAMKARLDAFRAKNRLQGRGGLEQIGCIVLSQPVFFPEPYWTPQPTNWPPRNLGPMRYDLTEDEGKRVWEHCLTTAVGLGLAGEPVVAQLRQSEDRWGEPALIRPRLGQAAFRLAVTEAYGRACAMTGEHSLPALESCHIRPYVLEGPHEISNGLLLRSDLHRLFDKGYVTVTTDYRIEVSTRLREHFQNGRSYYPLHGQSLTVPQRRDDRPDLGLLRWHNDVKFLTREEPAACRISFATP